jgi:HD superfamily phosphodiesterase
MFADTLKCLKPVSAEQRVFLERVRAAMEACFGEDRRRIEHALQVASFAEQLLAFIEADAVIALSAALLHDIGIHEAERVHGSSAGNWQELEGPPIARRILTELGASEHLIDRVATLVGCHHTPDGDASAEFRILWDADALVNFSEILVDKDDETISRLLNSHMTTEPGYQMARKLFLIAANPER